MFFRKQFLWTVKKTHFLVQKIYKKKSHIYTKKHNQLLLVMIKEEKADLRLFVLLSLTTAIVCLCTDYFYAPNYQVIKILAVSLHPCDFLSVVSTKWGSQHLQHYSTDGML